VTSTVTYKGKVHPIAGRITGVEVTFDREIDDYKRSSFFSEDGRNLQMRMAVFHKADGEDIGSDATLGPLVREYIPGQGIIVDGGRRRNKTRKQRRRY